MKNKGDMKVTILILAFFFLVLMGMAGFFASKLFKDKSKLDSESVTNTGTIQTSPDPANVRVPSPIVSQPQTDEKITSPVTIKGEVPPGWMSEGVFPVKIVDSAAVLIAQGQAKEDIPGSWQSGNSVSFTAVLSFTTENTAPSGSIRLEKDNPSGKPENGATYILPITF